MKSLLRMYSVAVVCALAAACTTTQQAKIDDKIANIDAKLYKYCVYLQGASLIATTVLDNNGLANKIDTGITAYCSVHVTDVPTAVAKLTSIYIQAVNEGVKPSPSL